MNISTISGIAAREADTRSVSISSKAANSTAKLWGADSKAVNINSYKPVSYPQKSKEWLDFRIGKVSGSRVGVVLGLSPYKTRDELLDEMVREAMGEEVFSGNAATRYGEKYEPIAYRRYVLQTYRQPSNPKSICVSRTGILEYTPNPRIVYSPDGILTNIKNVDGNGIANGVVEGLLEIKCPYSRSVPTVLPEHYMAQVQLGMAVTNSKYTDFVYYVPGSPLNIRRVDREEGWLDRHMPTILSFLDDYDNAISGIAAREADTRSVSIGECRAT